MASVPNKRLLMIIACTLGSLVCVAILIVAAPFFLEWMSYGLPIDWRVVSNVAQSFAGISAALAAAGLLALAASIFLQSHQLRLSRGHSVRDLQFRLLEMAMKDEVLAATYFEFKPVESFDEFRRIAFIEMRFRYLEFSLREDLISEQTLRYMIATQFFTVPAIREYWSYVASVWANEARSKEEITFVRVMNEEHTRNVGEEQGSMSTIQDTSAASSEDAGPAPGVVGPAAHEAVEP